MTCKISLIRILQKKTCIMNVYIIYYRIVHSYCIICPFFHHTLSEGLVKSVFLINYYFIDWSYWGFCLTQSMKRMADLKSSQPYSLVSLSSLSCYFDTLSRAVVQWPHLFPNRNITVTVNCYVLQLKLWKLFVVDFRLWTVSKSCTYSTSKHTLERRAVWLSFTRVVQWPPCHRDTQ